MILERRNLAHRTQALERARQDIAPRVRRVCAHLRDEEFDRLVTRMAEIDLKYRMRRIDYDLSLFMVRERRSQGRA